MAVTAKMKAFLELYLVSLDAADSYEKAYGKRDPAAACRLAKHNYVIAGLAKIRDAGLTPVAAERAKRANESAVIAKLEIHPLEVRHNRFLALADIATGNATQTKVTIDKDGVPHEYDVSPTFSEQIAAHKLILLMHGDLVTKTEIKETSTKTVFVKVDNGRGPAPIGHVALIPSDVTDYSICPHCSEAIEAKAFVEHENKCPERVANNPE